MALQYADAAIKTLTRAVPTVGADGNVISWNIEVEYSLNDYVSLFLSNINQGFEPKAPTSFTKEELLALANTAHFDLVYDSQYESVKVATPSVETVVSDFDLNTLA
jgi:hypothetical protein